MTCIHFMPQNVHKEEKKTGVLTNTICKSRVSHVVTVREGLSGKQV